VGGGQGGDSIRDINDFITIHGDNETELTDEQVQRMVKRDKGGQRNDDSGLFDDEENEEIHNSHHRKKGNKKERHKGEAHDDGDSKSKQAEKDKKPTVSHQAPEPNLLGTERKIVDGLI